MTRLPYRTHNVMLAPLCSMLPLDYELMCRCAKFMNNCLISGNDVVSYVARHGIFFQRMSSPIGRNAQRCCETAGLSSSNLHAFNKQLGFRLCIVLYRTGLCLLWALYWSSFRFVGIISHCSFWAQTSWTLLLLLFVLVRLRCFLLFTVHWIFFLFYCVLNK